MDINIASVSSLFLLLFFVDIEAYTDLYGEKQGLVDSDIRIICETDLQRIGSEDDDVVKRKIRWLRGPGPVVEDMNVLERMDGRFTIDTIILSETDNGRVSASSTLTIHRAIEEDSTNYTCCKRDTPMCESWQLRQQIQHELTILPSQPVSDLRITEIATPVLERSTDLRITEIATPVLERSTVITQEPSTISTTFPNEIGEVDLIEENYKPNVNGALRQRLGGNISIGLLVAASCALVAVTTITVAVVISVARWHWRKKNTNTPVEAFELA